MLLCKSNGPLKITRLTFRAYFSISCIAREANTCTEREMGLIDTKETYLPGGGGEQEPSSFAAEIAEPACSVAPTPLGSGWFESFSTVLGSWATTACVGSGSVGSGFFPSASTGSFISVTASVADKAPGYSSKHWAQTSLTKQCLLRWGRYK